MDKFCLHDRQLFGLFQEWGIGVRRKNEGQVRNKEEEEGLRSRGEVDWEGNSEQDDWEGRQDWLPVARPQ